MNTSNIVNNIKGIKKKRSSNIELFRIFAMFSVLMVHANFFTFQEPYIDTYYEKPGFALGQYFFESISIGCVDMFILISGWFGIRPKIKSFLNFIFQCLFFLIGIYVVCLITGITEKTPAGIANGIAGCLALLKSEDWFIKSYIGLYILAPVLNTYSENANEKKFRYLLISFFSFQTIYAWISGAAVFFESGYSTMSFMGLYLLARYIKLHPCKWTMLKGKYDLYIFMSCVLIITAISYTSMILAANIHPSFMVFATKMFRYTNPIVIFMSMYALLFFSKLSFTNNFINWLGASSFAVYLLHTNYNICRPYYCGTINMISDNFNGVYFFLILSLFLVAVFFTAILIDQIRIFLWNRITGHFKL